jgi:excisionase family DNA binding protein
MEPSELLSLDAATAMLGISKATMYRLLERGTLKGAKVGRQWRFSRAELEAYLQRGPASAALGTLPVAVLDAEITFFTAELARLGAPTLGPVSEDDPVTARLHVLLVACARLAAAAGASDIHFEPMKEGRATVGVVRFRLDGLLQEVRRLPQSVLDGLIQYARSLAESLPAGQPRPVWCDALLRLTDGEETLELRLSVLPGSQGETLCAHLLHEPSTQSLRLEEMGFAPDDVTRVRGWMQRPSGLVLVVGPSGSGKTTVMYKLLQEVTGSQRITVSIEDPIEFDLPWVTQIGVNARQGVTFPAALRALMRHDVDTVMVSEQRDLETIEISIYASYAGKLVLSQAHMNDPLVAYYRFVEVFPEVQKDHIAMLLSNGLVGVLGMRLVRRLCPHCATVAVPPMALLTRAYELAAAGGYQIPDDAVFHAPVGCDACRGVGYRGRSAIYQALGFTPEIRAAYLRKAPLDDIRALAIKTGMRTLVADGLRKAVEGITTVDEVLRVVQ